MAISAFYGLQGSPMIVDDGVICYPGGLDAYGNDVLPGYAGAHKADIVIVLMDIGSVVDEVIAAVPNIYAWSPIDHDPIPRSVIHAARQCKGFIAYSMWGFKKLIEAGLKPYYVPHAVSSERFHIVDKVEARQALKLPEDAFIVSIVSANKGAPSRKCFDEQIRAFSYFLGDVPNAILYLHTRKRAPGGEDVEYLLELNGVPEANYRFVPQLHYHAGLLDHAYMNNVYNASDVLMNASRGGGFELPLIEAQMAGCPVITTDFSAMPELVKTGWTVPVKDKFYTGFESYQVTPSIDGLYVALKEAHTFEQPDETRARTRDRVLDYDIKNVTEKYWKPTLEMIAKEIAQDGEETEPTKPQAATVAEPTGEVQEAGVELSLGVVEAG
jgi:glycosyltransferase involved in cell wall biosynthesis